MKQLTWWIVCKTHDCNSVTLDMGRSNRREPFPGGWGTPEASGLEELATVSRTGWVIAFKWSIRGILYSWDKLVKDASQILLKIKLKWTGLCNKECCPPPRSTRIKSLATVADLVSILQGNQSEDHDNVFCSLGNLAEPALIKYSQEKYLWTQCLASSHT